MLTTMLYFLIRWALIIQTLALNFCNSVLGFNLTTIDCLIYNGIFFLNILFWLIIKSSATLIRSSSGERDVGIFWRFYCGALATYLSHVSIKLKAFGGGILIIMESYFLQDFCFLLVIAFNNRYKSRQIWAFFFVCAHSVDLIVIAGGLRRCLVTICCWY